MKNNKYQITGIKGRLLHLGFVTCYLLIVLLYACEGGYDPSVQVSIGPPENVEDNLEENYKVTVHISSKINKLNEDEEKYKYEVEWESTGTFKRSVPSSSPETGRPETTTRVIMERTTFFFQMTAGDTVTITVKLLTLDVDGTPEHNEAGELVGEQVAEDTFTYTPPTS